MSDWDLIVQPISQGGYLGAPFEWGGRGPDRFDCWGLIRAVRMRLDQPVPDWDNAVYPMPKAVCSIFSKAAELPDWIAVPDAQPGDIIAMSTHKRIHHVGIATPWGVLHTSRGYGAIHQDIQNLRRCGYNLIQPYRYQGSVHG